jgi:Outer membrane protein beta-barrel domain
MRTSAPGRTIAGIVARMAAMTVLVGTTIASPAHAQGVVLGLLFGDRLATDNFNIGIEIGMNLPTVSGLDGASLSRGALFGLFASWRFSEHYHLFTGVLPLSAKGARDADPIPLNDPQLDPLIGSGRMDRDLDYVDIPVLLQWAQHRDGGIRVGVGPQIGFRTSAKDRYSGTTTQGTGIVLENDIGDSIESFDAGVAFDAEYRFTGLGLAIGVRYYQGLTDIAKGSGASLHNHVISGSGRIALGGRKPKKPAEPK